MNSQLQSINKIVLKENETKEIVQTEGSTEIILGKNSKLIHVMNCKEDWERTATLMEGAQLITKDVVINTTTKTTVNLKENANYESNTLQINSANSKVKIIHEGNNSKSKIITNSLTEQETTFVAKTIVEEQATNAECHQKQHTLLLHPDARTNNLPILEINNNNVIASHGVSIGTIDAEQLFYMRTRGLNCKEAKNAIIQGYINPFMKELPEINEQIMELLK